MLCTLDHVRLAVSILNLFWSLIHRLAWLWVWLPIVVADIHKAIKASSFQVCKLLWLVSSVYACSSVSPVNNVSRMLC